MNLDDIYRAFKTQAECISYLEKIRWNDTPKCPRCNSGKFSPVKGNLAYRCNFCNRTFTATSNTLFHRSQIDLQKWFYAIHLVIQPDKTLTIRELAEKILVAKDTAWAIQKKIKSALISSPELLLNIENNLNKKIWQT